MDELNEYSTSNAVYGTHRSVGHRTLLRNREETPWSTTNNLYGKEQRKTISENALSQRGNMATYYTQRSHPQLKSRPKSGQFNVRDALDQRLKIGVSKGSEEDGYPKLPFLDRSKYLVTMGADDNGSQKPARRSEQTISRTTSRSFPEYPPRTGPAKRFMLNQMERFMMAIPEGVRPGGHLAPLKEPPQILKVEHKSSGRRKKHKSSALPEGSRTSAMSHSVPSSASSGSSWSSSSLPSDDESLKDVEENNDV